VNGQFPGPTLEVNNGDTLVVKVTNKARYNVTIHWYHIKPVQHFGFTLTIKQASLFTLKNHIFIQHFFYSFPVRLTILFYTYDTWQELFVPIEIFYKKMSIK